MFIGIDPGITGGVVILSPEGQIVEAHVMPLLDGMVDLHHLVKIIRWHNPVLVGIEEVQYRMGQAGVVKMIRNWQRLEDACIFLSQAYQLVRAKDWEKPIVPASKRGDRKKLIAHYCQYANARWPGHLIPPRCRVTHDGLAAAACIADHIRQQYTKQIPEHDL